MKTQTVEEYLDSLRAAGRSQETCRQYRWQLGQWGEWCKSVGVVELDQLTKPLLRKWAAGIRDRWGPATCRVAVISVKSFLRWCAGEGLASADLADALKTPTRPRRQQRTATVDEVGVLLASCGGDATGMRNRALLSLAYDSLLRAGELCRLQVGDLDLDHQAVVVLGKGDRQEVVRFGSETAAALRAWLGVRSSVARCDSLFVGVGGLTPGQSMTRDGLRAVLRRLASRAGVDHLSPHALRRGGAVALIESGAPSRMVQLHGRWDDLRMLEVYTQKLDASRMFDTYSPVDRLNGRKKGGDRTENPTR